MLSQTSTILVAMFLGSDHVLIMKSARTSHCVLTLLSRCYISHKFSRGNVGSTYTLIVTHRDAAELWTFRVCCDIGKAKRDAANKPLQT